MAHDTLGHRLRYARKAKHFSVKLVAKYVGCAWQTLRGYEGGFGTVPYELVRLLSYLYEADINWLVNGEGEPPTVIPGLTPAEALMGFKTPPRKTAEARLRARYRVKPALFLLPKVRPVSASE